MSRGGQRWKNWDNCNRITIKKKKKTTKHATNRITQQLFFRDIYPRKMKAYFHTHTKSVHGYAQQVYL